MEGVCAEVVHSNDCSYSVMISKGYIISGFSKIRRGSRNYAYDLLTRTLGPVYAAAGAVSGRRALHVRAVCAVAGAVPGR